MQVLKKLIVSSLIAMASVAALAPSALAGPDDRFIGNGSTDSYRSMVTEYREYIARMSPENRAKLMTMQDKMMQMEMDQKSTQMKMEMDMAKARRDIELFILNNAAPGR